MSDSVIMCVDDDATGLDVRRMLLETRGYRVVTAENGSTALRLLPQHPVDLVVLDYYMPDMDGGLVAKELKRLQPGLPILMLSAYFWLPPAAMELCEDFVTKADSPAKFLAKVEELLSRERPS